MKREMSERARAPFPPAVVIAAALTAFLAAGVLVDRLSYFDDARATLRGHAGPAGMPNEGRVGRAVANALERFGATSTFGGLPEALPSTIIMQLEDLGGTLPVLSIAADEDHLNDPRTGIMTNMRATGPEWEKLASVSLWENGELVVGSRAGLRIHGDSSRFRGFPSFRLHFRPTYGASRLSGGRLLGPDAAPASAVVVHVVRYEGHYPNIFVFEIARRLGLPTVAFRPARVYLNGQPRGIYVLTERVMPDGWGRTHFGNPDFFMYVYKGETKQRSREAHDALEEWVRENRPLTMARAAERIDVPNLTRHLFTLMFCFTTDWAQGASMLDRDDPDARWFWMHWDMDQSFHVRGSAQLEPWQQPFFDLILLREPRDELEQLGIVTDDRHYLRHRDDIRRTIFSQLLRDTAYRRYFVRFVTDALNHELTSAFFDGMLARYTSLERGPGVYSRVDLGEYLRQRPDFVRSEIANRFNLGSPWVVRVEAPESLAMVIDGFPETGPYTGVYYRQQTFSVRLAEDAPRRLSHWVVDGERVDGAQLRLAVTEAHVIRPVLAAR